MNKLVSVGIGLVLVACNSPQSTTSGTAASSAVAPPPAKSVTPQSNMPPLDPKNIVSLAIGSKDHTTLVAAIKAADYVPSVANAGPLTVFAPTNAAFEKLPAGTVEGLLKPEKKEDLRGVLKYHVTTTAYDIESFKDGETLGMADGAKVKITVKDGKVKINDANIVASIRASNGMLHIVDAVLLPPKKE